MREQIVYVLENDAMPGLLKIGKTSQQLRKRIIQLSASTSAPMPFRCIYAVVVEDMTAVEERLKAHFAEFRVNKKREFFRVSIDDVKEALLQFALRDATADATGAEQDVEPPACPEMYESALYADACMAQLIAVLEFVMQPTIMSGAQAGRPKALPAGRVPKPESWLEYQLSTMHEVIFATIIVPIAVYSTYLVARDPHDIDGSAGGLILMIVMIWMLGKRSNGLERRAALLGQQVECDGPKFHWPPKIRWVLVLIHAKRTVSLWVARVPMYVYAPLVMADMAAMGVLCYRLFMAYLDHAVSRIGTFEQFLMTMLLWVAFLLLMLRGSGEKLEIANGKRLRGKEPWSYRVWARGYGWG